MTEDDTFNKLKREPDFNKVQEAINERLHGIRMQAINEVLSEKGWTLTEYDTAYNDVMTNVFSHQIQAGSIQASKISSGVIRTGGMKP